MARSKTSISLTQDDQFKHSLSVDYTYISGMNVELRFSGGAGIEVYEDGEFVGKLYFSDVPNMELK